MNTVQLMTEAGTQLAMRQFTLHRDAERFAFGVLGMEASNGEIVTHARIHWEDGTFEEYEF